MNIEYLKNFITIVQCGTILKASKILYISQPSLSNQIKELEKIYNCELLVRGSRRITLTSCGEIVFERAKQIISLYDSSILEVKDYKISRNETLRITLPPTLYQDLIHYHFSSFFEKYPNIRLEVYETVASEALKLLDNNVVELALINPSLMNLELYNHKELMKESFKVVLPNDHELLKNDSVSLNDLKNYQIALPRSYVDSILEQARMKNISLSIDTITSSTSGAIEIAKEKNILAIVPLPDNESPINKNCIKKLILPKYNEFSRNILWKKGSILSSVSQKFLDECDVK